MAIKEKMPQEQGEQALPENGQAAAPPDAGAGYAALLAVGFGALALSVR